MHGRYRLIGPSQEGKQAGSLLTFLIDLPLALLAAGASLQVLDPVWLQFFIKRSA
jgi:hypothetical protein